MTRNPPVKRPSLPLVWIIVAAAAVIALILARSAIMTALVSVGRGIYAMLIGPSQIVYWALLIMIGMIVALLSFRSSDEAAAKKAASIAAPLHEGRVTQLSRRLRVSSGRDTTRRDFAQYLLRLISDAKGMSSTESHRLLRERFERGDFELPPQVDGYLIESLREPDPTEPSASLWDVPPLVWIKAWLPPRRIRYVHDPRLDVLIETLESELDIPYDPHPE